MYIWFHIITYRKTAEGGKNSRNALVLYTLCTYNLMHRSSYKHPYWTSRRHHHHHRINMFMRHWISSLEASSPKFERVGIAGALSCLHRKYIIIYCRYSLVIFSLQIYFSNYFTLQWIYVLCSLILGNGKVKWIQFFRMF